MTKHPLARAIAEPARLERFQDIRLKTDRLAGGLIVTGGIVVVAAMLLILLYLLWTVVPLFGGASASQEALGDRSDWSEPATLFAVDERGDLGLRGDAGGRFEVFRLPGLATVETLDLALANGDRVTAVVEDLDAPGLRAAATESGQVLLFEVSWERLPGVPGEERAVAVELSHPFGDAPRFFAREPLRALALADRADRLVIAALAGKQLVVETATKRTNFLSGAVELDARLTRKDLDINATALVVDGNQRWVVVGDDQGTLHRFTLPELELVESVPIGMSPITVLRTLTGGISLIAGNASGELVQLFPVRGADDSFNLQFIRSFPGLGAPVAAIFPEGRRRGFAAVTADGVWGLYHSTAGERLLRGELAAAPVAMAFPRRADQLVMAGPAGDVSRLWFDNPHPEVNVRTLWRKVWYENYPEPRTVWQSTAANDSFEPKLSLTPLAFGTLKASLYAMAFAIPVALLGATYTAVFMAPALRRKVKPAIELMAAMPTVILGFLAGLWLAPFIEENLAGIFALALLVPPGLLLFAYAWSRLDLSRRWRAVDGWEPVLLIPVMIGLSVLALWLAMPLQEAVFGGDLRDWLSQDAGVSYDQRNAIVVGIAMGFSVIPIIFTIAEDALYAVPSSLSDGSLALGATRWQSLVRIVLPTASPGIFSGVMIGLGRAVGETMIVLMATGNTPIMGWSAFEGMRTLAANIAIEMPESSVNSTHFRVLLLSALVLFVFTFLVNTVAEVIRQRLRARYASL